MTKYSKNTIDFVRTLTAGHTSRPLATLLFINKQYPNNLSTYSLVLSATTIGITNGTTTYSITYVAKSTRQVAQELSNSPYPIEVKALANIDSLANGELKSSGSVIPNGFNFQDVSFDGKAAIVRSTRYSLIYNKVTAISVQDPYLEGPSLPWWGRITNGSFSQLSKGIFYHFAVPEYNTQTWSATWGRPFVDVEGESVNFVSKSVIKTARSPLLFKNNNIVIASVDGDKVFPSSIVKDVDTINGFVYLDPSIALPKNVLIYYTYLETSLLYKHINLNGHFSQNPYILDKYVVLYAKPVRSNSGIQRDRGIYHSIGTSIDDAIFSIPIEDPTEPIAIIGAINIKSSSSNTDINITDTRSFGGGLRDDALGKATEKKLKESQYFFDIANKEGIPYPGAASIVVELPSELKEVMSVLDVRERASKFIAAGVYPIFQFTDENYFDQYQPTELSTDLSLLNYTTTYSNTGFNTEVFGLTGRAANYINVNQTLPTSGFLNPSYVTTGYPNAQYENGLIKIPAGEAYKIPYIKSSPDAVFSYEERIENGAWSRKTIRNTIPVGTGLLSTQNIIIDSPYAYKEVKNFTGFAPYIINPNFWNNISYSAARTIKMTKELTSTNTFSPLSGYVTDVYTASTAYQSIGVIGIKDLVEPLMTHYNVCNEKNFFSGESLAYTAAAASYFATTGNTFPYPYIWSGNAFSATPYSGQYDAMRDIHALARLSKHRTDDVIRNYTTNTQSVLLTGVASWVGYVPSTYHTLGFSGAFNIANKVISLSPFTGNGTINSDIITPFYNPSLNVKIPLTGNYGPSEVSLTNNLQYGSDYIKAFAALYSAQVAPWTGNANYGVSLATTYNPKTIALSGIIHWTTYFENYFKSPTYLGTGVQASWLNTFNRVSDLGSRYLDNVCNGIDYLYYGNKAWAGYTGYEAKRPQYYNATYSPDAALSGDTTWHHTMAWPDFTNASAEDSLGRAITNVNTSLALMDPYIRIGATQGGIMQPGYIKAIKHYLWHPIHYAKSEPLFTGISPARNVETFELGMAAALKGCLNEDGIIVEGGSFNVKPAPFSGTVPSELFSACAKAIEYYTLVNDEPQRTKWQCVAQGIQKTMDVIYLKSGGYPFDVNSTTTSAGDPGSIPLRGLIELVGTNPTPFTVESFYSLTGSLPKYF